MKLAAYERELIGLEQAVRHWRPYLWGRCFVVRTDHYALLFLLHQRLSTLLQHQWVRKLFGYDFAVEFWPGRLNIAVDALSCQDETCAASSTTTPTYAPSRTQSSWSGAHLDALWMVSSSMTPASSSRWRPQHCLLSSSSSTPSAMRASRKLYIDYAPSSSSSRIAHWFVTLCARAPCAKGTRWNPFSRWVCCNP